MKYVVVLGDGMADYPLEQLRGRTPLEEALKPNIDAIADEVGLVKTIPNGMSPGSDIANLSVLGYNPKIYYTGRSPLEAVSIGIEMEDTDVAIRANFVTLSSEENWEDKSMLDYSASEISTKEASILIDFLKKHLDSAEFTLYAGTSYRNCLISKTDGLYEKFIPPHDISGKKLKGYLPDNKRFLELIKRSYELLLKHPLNLERIKKRKNPANALWFWGAGSKPMLTSFEKAHNKKGAVISAVDLIKGIGKCAEMTVIDVIGATGNIDTNFKGKAVAAVDALKKHDFVYLHIEAPDECGHRGETENKIKAIELIDSEIIAYLLKNIKEDFKLLFLPDHETPISLKTHASGAVPYLIYDSTRPVGGGSYCERAAKGKKPVASGTELLKKFLGE